MKVVTSGVHKFQLQEPINGLRHLDLFSIELHQNELPGVAFLLRSYVELETLTIELGERTEIEVSNLTFAMLQSDEQLVPY